ncbi:MAG: glutathione S-transferase N-terminal domain-containing protein [Gammaproteobacteria bacterium]|jgi:RNA polymerase-associated protein|nr:stringent starvation protein A [Gammaproteobacteria bacterium]MCH2343322.1 glutathione S-transferase N-terminal domain-containing protein [Pseudomonadales bacterium]MEC9224007.1 glutathione S-transferase N-terminal domain-containing protein [Pseudomonadota bacterium]MCS5581570.1 glutathione S-transferase N-terminal domain-containing protein [Gammaproteobacteria bacterium]MEE2608982.1 glutathione S-transferase N-terminal domain-containing protein [Pseudomonadota bacterium]|tara:strand:+ start:336 stop:968 length:633 start_codon:yes stop_codon:yes gene_type:complete
MGVVAKRSSMTFYSDGASHYSHRVRIVLAEKGVAVETIDVDLDNKPEDLAALNPYNTLPTLVDRDLVLYEADIMMEYLDERFPHPPLFPVYPVARAQSRLWIFRIQKDWCSLVDSIMAGSGTSSQVEKTRKNLRESLISIAPIFGEKPFFMSDEFTIVDCCVTPILWRLPVMGIELPKTKTTKPLLDYRDRLFERESVMASLSEQEKEMV